MYCFRRLTRWHKGYRCEFYQTPCHNLALILGARDQGLLSFTPDLSTKQGLNIAVKLNQQPFVCYSRPVHICLSSLITWISYTVTIWYWVIWFGGEERKGGGCYIYVNIYLIYCSRVGPYKLHWCWNRYPFTILLHQSQYLVCPGHLYCVKVHGKFDVVLPSGIRTTVLTKSNSQCTIKNLAWYKSDR